MSAQYNDGTVQYGSRAVVVKKSDGTTTRGTYVFDNISVRRPTKKIQRTNQLGEPSGSVGVADFVEGSAQYQFATSTTSEIEAGDQLIFDGTVNPLLDQTTANGGYDSETFFVNGPSRTETKDGERKGNIEFIKKYN